MTAKVRYRRRKTSRVNPDTLDAVIGDLFIIEGLPYIFRVRDFNLGGAMLYKRIRKLGYKPIVEGDEIYWIEANK